MLLPESLGTRLHTYIQPCVYTAYENSVRVFLSWDKEEVLKHKGIVQTIEAEYFMLEYPW